MKVKDRLIHDPEIKDAVLDAFPEKEVSLERQDTIKKVVLRGKARSRFQRTMKQAINMFIGESVDDYLKDRNIPVSEIVAASIEITMSNSTNTLLNAEVVVEVKTFNGTYLDEVIPITKELQILNDIAYDMQLDQCSLISTQQKRLGKYLN